jgi:hypothetical protein
VQEWTNFLKQLMLQRQNIMSTLSPLFVLIEYRFYKPDLEKRIAERKAAEERRKKAQLDKLKKDISKTHGGTVVLDAKPPAPKTLDDIDAEEEDAEEEFDAAYDEEEEGSILSYCCC